MDDLHVSKAQLARAIDVLPSEVARFFNTTAHPTMDTMRKMERGVVTAAESL